MMQRTNAKHRLRAETLEPRLMLAGDVSAAVLGGNLRILGDKLDNEISITETAPGTFLVSGLDGTTINQQPAGTPFEAHDVTNNVFIRMGDGNDTVDLHQVSIHGNLDILTGGGNDDIEIVGAEIARNARIDSGPGDDVVNLGTSSAAQPVIAAASPLPTGVRIKNNLDIHTGLGDDEVELADTHIGGNALVDTGAGNDTIVMGLASSPPPAATAGASVVPSGDANVSIGHHLFICAGAGDDTVQVNSVRARLAVISTGDGNDHLIATNSAAEHALIFLGDGDDVLDASGGGNTVGHLHLFGGEGDDTLINGPNNQVADLDVHSIEHSI
jgi:hypothetical protein